MEDAPLVKRGRDVDATVKVLVNPETAGSGTLRGVLTVLTGSRPGMLVTIGPSGVTLGRTEDAKVTLDDDSLSRRHARFFEMNGQYFVEDLQSTNGTFVDGSPVRQVWTLEDGARVQLGVGTLLRFALQDETELEVTRRLYEATVRDLLTGVFNRHFFDERLHAELSYAKRHGADLSLLFIDVDHFKEVNDTYGHAAGDEVLRSMAQLIASRMRSEDIVARYGGEEFVVMLRGIPVGGVVTVAERLRMAIEALRVGCNGRAIPITVSVGVAIQAPERDHASAEALLAAADGALYRAKEAGRNQVYVG